MNRENLEHLIRAAAEVTDEYEFVIVGSHCLEVIDLFMAKTAANREKDREFNIALLRYGYVSPDAAIDMVALMPIDDAQKKAMRARIRRWVKILEDRGYRLP